MRMEQKYLNGNVMKAGKGLLFDGSMIEGRDVNFILVQRE